MFIQAINQEFF